LENWDVPLNGIVKGTDFDWCTGRKTLESSKLFNKIPERINRPTWWKRRLDVTSKIPRCSAWGSL
jgi:hypothetical protein